MLKKIILYTLGLIAFIVLGIFIYQNLPIEITRKSEMTLGNKIIKNIEAYQSIHNELPKENDWETLGKLGFQIHEMGTQPNYTYNNQDAYEIVFLEGFNGPYLLWNSIERKWKIGFPTVFITAKEDSITFFRGNQVLFIRPSDEKFKSLEGEQGIYEVDSDFGFGIQRTIDSLRLQSKYKDLKFEVVTERFIEIKDCKNCPIKIDTDTLLYTTLLISPGKEIKIIEIIHSMGYLSAIDDFFDVKSF
ncbi:hypothetical protein MG290_10535 [Flavobacterium sp. CBA20B-1]|uniref:hypothetical protein n=1 Tax=unclassified Flavobacterium TaxID=196869 RepID=UPI0022247BAD|nr:MULTISPECIES: hypothetical protein [unclassified Flavobacterium]WCM41393.1 hypothetical protein MG290_10535 [Flavobacterium sp. CBA20B-1]